MANLPSSTIGDTCYKYSFPKLLLAQILVVLQLSLQANTQVFFETIPLQALTNLIFVSLTFEIQILCVCVFILKYFPTYFGMPFGVVDSFFVDSS